jgi:hypothetical protein
LLDSVGETVGVLSHAECCRQLCAGESGRKVTQRLNMPPDVAVFGEDRVVHAHLGQGRVARLQRVFG